MKSKRRRNYCCGIQSSISQECIECPYNMDCSGHSGRWEVSSTGMARSTRKKENSSNLAKEEAKGDGHTRSCPHFQQWKQKAHSSKDRQARMHSKLQAWVWIQADRWGQRRTLAMACQLFSAVWHKVTFSTLFIGWNVDVYCIILYCNLLPSQWQKLPLCQ